MASLELILLSFSPVDDVALGFSRLTKKTYKIKLPPITYAIGDIIIFHETKANLENGIYIPGPSSVKIRKVRKDDGIFFEGVTLMLKAYFGCSGDPSHRSYNKEVAFTDWYGYVDMSPISSFPVERNKVYSSIVCVNDLDYEKNGTQLFKIHVNDKFFLMEKKAPDFLKEMIDYENKCAEETAMKENLPPPQDSNTNNENDASQTKSLLVADTPKLCEKKSKHPTLLKPILLSFSSVDGLALGFCRSTKKAYKIKLPLNTYAVGEIIMFDEKEKKLENGVYVPEPSNVRKKKESKRDGISFVGEILTLKAFFGCSGDPNHRSYNKKVAFTDWYGYVDMSPISSFPVERNKVYSSRICVNDLDYEKNGTELFKIYVDEMFVFVETTEENFLSDMIEFENEYTEKVALKENSPPSPGADEQIGDFEKDDTIRIDSFVIADSPPIPEEKNSVERGSLMSFIVQEYDGDIAIPVADSIRVRKPGKEEGIMVADNFMLEIDAYLTFSRQRLQSNNSQLLVGFSNSYGFVYVEKQRDLKPGVVYKTVIKVYQSRRMNEPVFRNVTRLEEVRDFHNLEVFLHEMAVFEQKVKDTMKIEERHVNNNNYGYNQYNNRSRETPRSYRNEAMRKNPYYTKSDKAYLDKNREARASYRDMLVTELYERLDSNGSYGKAFCEKGEVELETKYDVSGHSMLEVGDWFRASLTAHKHKSFYGVDKIEKKIDNLTDFRISDTGIFIAIFRLDLRTVKPSLGQYTVVEVDYLNFVAVTQKHYEHMGKRFNAEFAKLKRPLRGPDGEEVFWQLHEKLEDIPDRYYQDSSPTEKETCGNYDEFEGGEFILPKLYTGDRQNRSSMRSSRDYPPPPRSSASSSHHDNNKDYFFDKNEPCSSSSYSMKDSKDTDEKRASNHERDQSSSCGMATKKENRGFSRNYPAKESEMNGFDYGKRSSYDDRQKEVSPPPSMVSRDRNRREHGVVVSYADKETFIVFSFQRRLPILLDRRMAIDVTLGDYINFESKQMYRPFLACDYEVTYFICKLDPNAADADKVWRGADLADVECVVDLCARPAYSSRVRYFLYQSDDVGDVFVSERMWPNLARDYENREYARNMRCRCRYVLYDEDHGFDPTGERGYHWQLIDVENYTPPSNGNAKSVVDYDDIDKMKMMNKMRDMSVNDGFEKEPERAPSFSEKNGRSVNDFEGTSSKNRKLSPTESKKASISGKTSESGIVDVAQSEEAESLKQECLALKTSLRRILKFNKMLLKNQRITDIIRNEDEIMYRDLRDAIAAGTAKLEQ